MNTNPRRFRRGDTSLERPGLVFWGIHRGKERWVAPTMFEHLRVAKNAWQRQWSKTPQGRIKRNAESERRRKLPHVLAYQAEYQRKKRSIYGPRQLLRRRAYKKMRRTTDPLFRLKANISTRMREGFKRVSVRKQSKRIDLLGCTFEFFKQWISDQLESGMTFENYAFDTWHIDHIIPVCLFDLSDETAAKHAFNYRNCRPAWGKPNLSKNGRLDVSLVAKHNLWEWLPYTSSHSELKHAA